MGCSISIIFLRMFTHVNWKQERGIPELDIANREELDQLLQLIELNLQQYRKSVNSKKFWKALHQLEEILGRKLFVKRPSEPPYLKELAAAEWIAAYNIRHVLNRLKVWNEEVEERMLKLRADEINRYRTFIQQRPTEYNASTLSSNVFVGDFPRIRRTTLGEYMLLYGQHL